MRWLAWAVQNPDEHPGTIVVLKSRRQGTGKSTLGVVMLIIFGQHGALIDDSDRLLGRFNDWVEPVSFILAEEILWAGDHKTADKLKSRVTAGTFQIERKNGAIRQMPNRLHLMMTTNHEHAVAAGVGDRRLAVYDVGDEHACDKSWFDPLYRDLDDGGASEFLYLLQNLKLGDWHPRQILKTAETTEQQRMSGDSVSQWSQACIYADAINGLDLGMRISWRHFAEHIPYIANSTACMPLTWRYSVKPAQTCSDPVSVCPRSPVASNAHGAMTCQPATHGRRRSTRGSEYKIQR